MAQKKTRGTRADYKSVHGDASFRLFNVVECLPSADEVFSAPALDFRSGMDDVWEARCLTEGQRSITSESSSSENAEAVGINRFNRVLTEIGVCAE